jgi:hypothetical protein
MVTKIIVADPFQKPIFFDIGVYFGFLTGAVSVNVYVVTAIDQSGDLAQYEGFG